MDIIEAFEALGHEVDTIDIEMTNKNPEGRVILDAVAGLLTKGIYDAVFSVNFYPVLSKICNAFKVRYISWTTDCPVEELFTEEIKNPFNRTFCFDYAQYEKAHAFSENTVFYMPLAANVDRWDGVLLESAAMNMNAVLNLDNLDKWKADISFVGSLYTEKKGEDWFIESAKTRLLMVEAVKSVVAAFEDERLADLEDCNNLTADSDEGDAHRGISFAVYTGSDTKELGIDNRGRVKTHTEMPLVFANSKINLNMTCDSIKSGIPQRIWDIMGCRGFVLTNYQPEIDEYFEIGKDIEVFHDMDELKEKLAYYLVHEDERIQIANRGYEKVKKEHTFINRMADILYIAFAI